MGRIRVRATEPEDIDAIAEIFDCPGVIPGTLQIPFRSVDFRRERFVQRSTDMHHLVAEIDGRVVGTASLHVESRPRRRHCGNIGMAVHDDFQSQGVGSALMEAVIDLADNWLGLTRLELTVYADNAPAIHVYKKYGFEVEGTARNFAVREGTFIDAIYMARLRPPPHETSPREP